MKALITGASSGIGRDIAREFANMGIDLVLAARRTDRLIELKDELGVNTEIITCDLSNREQCMALYEKTRHMDIDILVNNAGFGLFGEFSESDLQRETEMIDVNICAVHILTKLFLRDFKEKDSGYILNVASSAAFLPGGPLLSAYYATKSYVLRLSEAIYEELRREKSKVTISVLCPGPVKTEFDKTANVSFSVKGLTSQKVAKVAVRGMFNRKLIIIPGFLMKAARILEKFLPEKMLLRIAYHMQKRKKG